MPIQSRSLEGQNGVHFSCQQCWFELLARRLLSKFFFQIFRQQATQFDFVLARAQRVEDKRGHPRDRRRLQDLVRVVENIPFWLFDAEFRPRLLEAHGGLLAIMVAP